MSINTELARVHSIQEGLDLSFKYFNDFVNDGGDSRIIENSILTIIRDRVETARAALNGEFFVKQEDNR